MELPSHYMETRRSELWEAFVLTKDEKCTVQGEKCTVEVFPKRRARGVCEVEGCDKTEKTGGKCSSHGGGKRCRAEGCEKLRQTGGKCSMHGGGARCQINGCNKKLQREGKCAGHLSGRRCQVVGCLREFCQRVIRADADGVQHHIKIQDVHKGSLEAKDEKCTIETEKCTVKDGKCTVEVFPTRRARRLCKFEGCDKTAKNGGKCSSHGGGKRCRAEGCEKQSVRHGNCGTHGGASFCQVTGCDKKRQTGGKCSMHGGGARCQINGCNKKLQRGGKCAGHLSGRSCQVVGCLREFCQRVIRADADGVQHHIKKQDVQNIGLKGQESCDNDFHASKKRKTRQTRMELPSHHMKTKRAELWEASIVPKIENCKTEEPTRRVCQVEGCYKKQEVGETCMRHVDVIVCMMKGCEKQSLRCGKCMKHGGRGLCTVKGCEQYNQSGGKCKKHGGGGRCQMKGCKKPTYMGGKCCGHTAGGRCQVKGCEKFRQSGGKCNGHASGRHCQVVGCLRKFCLRVLREDADGFLQHIKKQDMGLVFKRELSDGTIHAFKKRKTVAV